MGPLDRVLSEKIKSLSVLCSMLVCLNHAYAVPAMLEDASWSGALVAVIQNFFRYGVSRISTPFFFMVAAYLLFRETETLWPRYRQEVHKRVRTLVGPFLLWSAWSFVFILCLQQIPSVSGQGGRAPLAHLPMDAIARMVLWDPAAYPLWFVRDLFLLVCMSPVVALLFRSRMTAVVVLTIAAMAWCAFPEIKETRACLFFGFGAYLAMHSTTMPITTPPARHVILALWLGISVINAILMVRCGHEISSLTCLAIVTGLLAVWTNWDSFRPRIGAVIFTALAPYTFFVYVAHQPVEDMLRAACLRLLGTDPAAALAAFVITAMTTFFGCMVAAVALDRYAPRFFAFIAGGRGAARTSRSLAPVEGKQSAI